MFAAPLVALAFVAITTDSAYAQRRYECLKVAGKDRNGLEEGNLESDCRTLRADGEWVKARLVAPYGRNWCAEVEPRLEAGVKGYRSLGECLLLRNATMRNATWVKVRGRPAGRGGGTAPSFATLPSARTFTGMGAPSTLKAAGIATSCEEASDTGEVTSMSTVGKLVITFTGCQVTNTAKETCTIKSASAKGGEIVTTTLMGQLGTTKSEEATSEVGLLLLPESGKRWTLLSSTKCSAESQVTGSLAAEVLPISEKTEFGGLDFEVSSGKQNIKKITVSSGVEEPELVAFAAVATEELEDGIEFTGEVEIV